MKKHLFYEQLSHPHHSGRWLLFVVLVVLFILVSINWASSIYWQVWLSPATLHPLQVIPK